MNRPLPPPPPPSATPSATRCYRHPDREAGRRCTRCGRPACNECLLQADVGSQCVECYKAGRPAASARVRNWQARQPAIVTSALMAINVAIFLWMGVADRENLTGGSITPQDADLGLTKRLAETLSGEFRVGVPGPNAVDGQFINIFGTSEGEWYRLVTSGFLHFGIIHLAFNMLMLYQLGNMLERDIGRVRFGLLYFASLLGGSAGALLLSPDRLSGGASGAVFGLLGAAAIGMHQRGVNPLSTGLGTTILINLMITFWLPNISIGGHLGGLVAGAAAGWFVTAPRHKNVPSTLAYAAPVIVGAAAVIVAFIAGSA